MSIYVDSAKLEVSIRHGDYMKAAQIKEYGGIDKIQVVEVDKPKAEEGQVLVEVYASSINPFDTTIRSGAMKDSIALDLPVTLGGDVAGVVVGVGASVAKFVEGDKVYGQANVVAGNSGAFAEFAAASREQVAIMPENLSFNEAASLPLVGVSAWQAMVKHLEVEKEQKVFIHGGAGGIGSLAIQIAKNIGAYVATTATGDDMDFVSELGADEVIDYKKDKFYEVLSDYDCVFDTVGGEDFQKSFSMLKAGGKAVTMIADFDEERADDKGVVALRQMTKVTTEALDEVTKLVEAKVLKQQVSAVFSLDDIQKAFREKEEKHSKGKIVIEIKK